MRSEPLLRVVAKPDVVTSLLALYDAAFAMPSGTGEVAIYADRFPDGIAEHSLRVWCSPKLRDGLELTEHRYEIAGLARTIRVTRGGMTMIRLLMTEVKS